MEFNRNHYFMAGLVVLALGLQFRYVDSYVLNERATKILNKEPAQTDVVSSMFYAASSAARIQASPRGVPTAMSSGVSAASVACHTSFQSPLRMPAPVGSML